ncbi:hypothetical protein ACIPPJ_30065 [Streptomyces sp. NPDC086091]|uniref:hypothetical protein n=1 Tax=Streptomyces sp. NPDC086091 TaxID=3365751 RepID=UPI0037F53F11
MSKNPPEMSRDEFFRIWEYKPAMQLLFSENYVQSEWEEDTLGVGSSSLIASPGSPRVSEQEAANAERTRDKGKGTGFLARLNRLLVWNWKSSAGPVRPADKELPPLPPSPARSTAPDMVFAERRFSMASVSSGGSDESEVVFAERRSSMASVSSGGPDESTVVFTPASHSAGSVRSAASSQKTVTRQPSSDWDTRAEAPSPVYARFSAPLDLTALSPAPRGPRRVRPPHDMARVAATRLPMLSSAVSAPVNPQRIQVQTGAASRAGLKR